MPILTWQIWLCYRPCWVRHGNRNTGQTPYCGRGWAGTMTASGAVLRWAVAGGRAMQVTAFKRSAVAILIPLPPLPCTAVPCLCMPVPVLGMAVPLLCMAVPARADEVYRPAVPILKVAHEGDPVPGVPDATFAYLAPPAIDAQGNVVFAALMEGPGST